MPEIDPDQTVHVVSNRGGRRRAHTDPECVHLESAGEVYPKRWETLSDSVPLCRECSGERSPGGPEPGTNSRATRNELAALSPEDLGLAPMVTGGNEQRS